ncbi:hypothetical protein SCHPADRAFT_934182 [Schizopora paradoxa]|uniref:Uncharacterized protein n=1 Tax=Schizopora paradoxa TaxID=27342 RepID=A0A0H2SF02_9AGAM|nr:hypothetical protein SCHPADRAFT_934182 [Schizopora paradoxa]
MDIHLDWCPTCDRQIMPRQYVVPALPSPQPQAAAAAPSNLQQLPTNPPPSVVKSSQTTRGKHGTIKARVQGGGLVQGTGRVRPGGLRRESSTSGKANNAASTGGASRNRSPQKLQAQQQQQQLQQQVLRQQQQQRLTNSSATAQPPSPAAGQPQRLIIDQSPTPLYCSEECRLADKNGFDLAAAAMVKRSKSRSTWLPRGLSDTNLDDHLRMRVGPHPSQINPATASPPPASPTIPPAPPNSVLGVGIDLWEMLPPPDKLARALSEADTSSSSGSSDSGRSFGTSNASEQDLPTGPTYLDPKLTDPRPPEVGPLPPHPHRPSAPVRKPNASRRSASSSGQEGGLFMAARRISSIFRSQESIVREKAEEDERQLRSLGAALFDPSRAPRGALGHDLRTDKNVQRDEEEDLVNESRSWVASTHRHALPVEAGGTMGTEKSRAELNRAVPSRTQSSLELFSQYALFSAGSGKGKRPTPRPALPSISTSLTSVHASSSHNFDDSSLRSAGTSSTHTATERLFKDYQISPEEEPLYEGKRFSLKHEKAKAMLGFPELKGHLLLSDKLLTPYRSDEESFPPIKPSSAPGPSDAFRPDQREHPIRRTLSGGSRRDRLVREASEVSVSRNSARSELGILKEEGEEGEWHTQKYAESECGSGSVASDDRGRMADSRSEGGHVRLKPHRKMKTSRSVSATSQSSSRKGSKEGRLGPDSRTWSYENFQGPMYSPMPRIPTTSYRVEEEFVPDEETGNPRRTPYHIAKLSIYEDDEELGRKEIRELSRRRGEHEGRRGWWIEKEWEIKSTPKFKRLFFNSPNPNSLSTPRKGRSPS